MQTPTVKLGALPEIVARRVGRGPAGSDHGTPVGDRDRVPGEFVTMSTGPIWFHPYDGSPPTRFKPTDDARAEF